MGRMVPKSKHEFIHVSHMLHTLSLKIVFYNVLNNFVQETKFHSMEFSTCDIMLSFGRMGGAHACSPSLSAGRGRRVTRAH
jgi:hypothetical protein